MKQAKTIQAFMVGAAHYVVSGTNGDEAVLRIDYQHNTYSLESQRTPLNPAFQQEVSEIAEDLLRRKHGINFANKLTHPE
ncbi:MAG TPA: hypothetical protein VLH38_00705 [Patescibacteria group bacterium]|nr:hypothetical protein [Patescibacteria group bacterium]